MVGLLGLYRLQVEFYLSTPPDEMSSDMHQRSVVHRQPASE